MDVYSMYRNLPNLVGSFGGTDGGESVASSVSAATLTADSSAFPRQSAARILNSAGNFICPVPASNLTFPYNATVLPDSLSALTWANVPAVNSSGTAFRLSCHMLQYRSAFKPVSL